MKSSVCAHVCMCAPTHTHAHTISTGCSFSGCLIDSPAAFSCKEAVLIWQSELSAWSISYVPIPWEVTAVDLAVSDFQKNP